MIVLDTHAWIWWATSAPRLSAAARRAIDEATLIGVTAISTWEIAMLVEHGRLELDRPPLTWVKQALALPRVTFLELTAERAVAAATLAELKEGDAADRMIVATAMSVRAPVVTKDRAMRRCAAIRTIW
jgi:PIN domain nuclease of toxin-antitoxin system